MEITSTLEHDVPFANRRVLVRKNALQVEGAAFGSSSVLFPSKPADRRTMCGVTMCGGTMQVSAPRLETGRRTRRWWPRLSGIWACRIRGPASFVDQRVTHYRARRRLLQSLRHRRTTHQGRQERHQLDRGGTATVSAPTRRIFSCTSCSAPGSLDTSLSHAAGLIEIAACHA